MPFYGDVGEHPCVLPEQTRLLFRSDTGVRPYIMCVFNT